MERKPSRHPLIYERRGLVWRVTSELAVEHYAVAQDGPEVARWVKCVV